MPFAVTLRLDAAAATQVEALWSALAERGISNSARRLAYPPHVTLAVYEEKAKQAALADAVQRAAAKWRRVRVICPALGVFPDPPAALFLIATSTEALLRMQAELCEALPREHLHPHYRPGTWLPHVTVADDLPLMRVPAAMAAAGAVFRPVTVTLEQADLVRFRPVRLLWQAPLEELPS